MTALEDGHGKVRAAVCGEQPCLDSDITRRVSPSGWALAMRVCQPECLWREPLQGYGDPWPQASEWFEACCVGVVR